MAGGLPLQPRIIDQDIQTAHPPHDGVDELAALLTAAKIGLHIGERRAHRPELLAESARVCAPGHYGDARTRLR